jgi:nucleotide-binding universal stress UspA family protein
MSQINPKDTIKIESIFHPSDFSEASEIAFAHALKSALVTGSKLSILHVSANPDEDWHDFPGVRGMLERWNILPKDSPRSAVADLGIDARKVLAVSQDPVQSCLGYLEKNPADLIVLAVHHHEGRMRWLGKSVGEPIARGASQMTLFIPHGVEGFVSRATGAVSLRNILIPVTKKPLPQPALEATARLVRALEQTSGTVTLLHVGEDRDMPPVTIPENTGWTWNQKSIVGDPVITILKTATELKTDLIVMTTDGPDGFLDGLRGTTSERVLRQAHCPVAVLPHGSLLG